jgi:hypothetical protein
VGGGIDDPQAGHDTPPGVSRALDRTFKIGLFLKAADGVLEIAGGIALLFLSAADIQHLVRALVAHSARIRTTFWPTISCVAPSIWLEVPLCSGRSIC